MSAKYAERVVPCFAGSRTPRLLVIGEAPGPRGANRTGFPFWGDDSGLDIYGLFEALGLLRAPLSRWKRGADISGTRPPAGDYAITNACPQMPLADDGGFCAPEPERLLAEGPRLASEIASFEPKVVLACGKAAAFALAQASRALGVEPPAPLAGKLAALKLTEAMAQLADSKPWMMGPARAFVTCHPARGQWRPQTPTGKLHARVMERVRTALDRAARPSP